MNLPVYYEVFQPLPDGNFEILEQGRSTQQDIYALREHFEQLCQQQQIDLMVTAHIIH